MSVLAKDSKKFTQFNNPNTMLSQNRAIPKYVI